MHSPQKSWLPRRAAAFLGLGFIYWLSLLIVFHLLDTNLLLAADPSLGEKDSHQWFIRQLTNQSSARYAETLNLLTRYLKEHPEEVQAYIERCKFIENASTLDDDDSGDRQKELDDGLTDLEEKFPKDPAVVLYRASHLRGEEKVIYLEGKLLTLSRGWPQMQVAEAWETLAWHHYRLRHYDRAGPAAQQSMEVDPSRDLSLILAHYHRSSQQPENALSDLRSKLDAPGSDWILEQKAELLCDLEAFPESAHLFRRVEAETKQSPDLLRYARALEKTGDLEHARQKLAKANTLSLKSQRIPLELFLFDMRHGSGATALSSYNALRNRGFEADPFLRYRLALAFKYPGGAWNIRDLAGVLALLAAALAIVLLPALGILPVHYIGLLRRQSKPLEPQRDLYWNLRHFWGISSAYLFAAFVLFVMFDYQFLISKLGGMNSGKSDLKEHLAPAYTVLFFTLALSTASMLRPIHWKLLIETRWSWIKTGFRALVFMLSLRLFAFFLLKWTGDSIDVAQSNGAIISISSSLSSNRLWDIMGAIDHTYGAGLLILIAVLIVPFYEEFVFRGIILDSCERHLSFHAANFLQAILFASVHDNLSLAPFYVLFALIGGLLRRESAGLAASTLIHMGNNLLAVLPLFWKVF